MKLEETCMRNGGNVYEKTNQCMYVSSDDERDQYVFICGAGSRK